MSKPKVQREKYLGILLEFYMQGYTNKQISEELGITKQKVAYLLDSFRKDYLSTIASRGLVPRYKKPYEIVDDINKSFYEMLTDPNGPLGNEEMLYCAHYVSTGSSIKAIELSGFAADLESGTKDIREINLTLRSEALKRKKNIQTEIRRLQMERAEMLDATKDRILAMHLEFIDQLKEENAKGNKSLIVKLLDQVNKMQGNYATVVRREEVTADDVFGAMKSIFDAEKPEELQ